MKPRLYTTIQAKYSTASQKEGSSEPIEPPLDLPLLLHHWAGLNMTTINIIVAGVCDIMPVVDRTVLSNSTNINWPPIL